MASQQQIDSWWAWATGVLNGIGAPTSPINYKTLWNWSVHESGAGNPMRWNNPLNTTQNAPGAVSQNDVGVKSYPDISSGVAATVQTLTNGRYPDIVSNLKNDSPVNGWKGNATAQLGVWGSGAGWIRSNANPPAASNDFWANALTQGSGSNAVANSNPVGDAINAALGPIGSAITGAENSFVQSATYVFLIGIGALMFLAGVALLAVLALQSVPAPVKRLASGAASVTPQGRAVVAVKATASPKPAPEKPLSPGAQSAVTEARAGRGSKLTPEVKAELRGRKSA